MTKTPQDGERQFLLTQERAAKSLNICVQTLKSYRVKGLIEAVPLGGRWMYRPEALEEFAKRGTTETVHN